MADNEIYKKFGNDYLIIDFNNLFLTDSIEDEILVYSKNHMEVKNEVTKSLSAFKTSKISLKKNLTQYSGGERVLICCAINYTVLKLYGIKNKKVLLVNILESLSLENYNLIKEKMQILRNENGIEFFTLDDMGMKYLNI